MRKVSISKACELPSTRRISPRPSHTCSPRPLCVVFQHRFRGHCQHTSTRLITLEMSLPTVSSISNTVSFKLQLPTMHPPVHPCIHPSIHPFMVLPSVRPSIFLPTCPPVLLLVAVSNLCSSTPSPAPPTFWTLGTTCSFLPSWVGSWSVAVLDFLVVSSLCFGFRRVKQCVCVSVCLCECECVCLWGAGSINARLWQLWHAKRLNVCILYVFWE